MDLYKVTKVIQSKSVSGYFDLCCLVKIKIQQKAGSLDCCPFKTECTDHTVTHIT